MEDRKTISINCNGKLLAEIKVNSGVAELLAKIISTVHGEGVEAKVEEKTDSPQETVMSMDRDAIEQMAKAKQLGFDFGPAMRRIRRLSMDIDDRKHEIRPRRVVLLGNGMKSHNHIMDEYKDKILMSAAKVFGSQPSHGLFFTEAFKKKLEDEAHAVFGLGLSGDFVRQKEEEKASEIPKFKDAINTNMLFEGVLMHVAKAMGMPIKRVRECDLMMNYAHQVVELIVKIAADMVYSSGNIMAVMNAEGVNEANFDIKARVAIDKILCQTCDNPEE